MRRFLFHRILSVSALLVSVSMSDTTVHPHCGTALAAQHRNTKSGATGVSLRMQGVSLPSGRVLKTAHFAIHYTLAPTVHRPRFVTADSALLRQINTILQGSFSTTIKRDSTVNAAFVDSIAPNYVRRAAVYFERAYSYYYTTLGMMLPNAQGSSSVFFHTTNDGELLTVDIADIGTADPDYNDSYYAITYPPAFDNGPSTYASSTILLENDFLYFASVNSSGVVTGTPIQANDANNQLLHNYTTDWEMGLKVTASHEFYHLVQYTYTPNPDYHAWYELSAVGMEERLAPEVNDYFQYLPSVLKHHETVSIMTLPPTTENYGNSMFHQFITQTLGTGFDVKLWDLLRNNGNDLPSALSAIADSSGTSWTSLYSSYVAAIATAGRAGSTTTCTDTTSVIFSRDIRCWPTPSYDTLPKEGSAVNLSLAPTTFRLLKPSASSSTTRSVNSSGLGTPKNVFHNGSAYSSTSITFNPFNVPSETATLFVSIPNASFSQSGQAILATRGTKYITAPNPVKLIGGATVAFFTPHSVTSGSMMNVVSESGLRVAELPFDSTNSAWSWNLKNKQGILVPPGAYYYQFPAQTPKTLLILPP